MVEQESFKFEVVGSIPTGRTMDTATKLQAITEVQQDLRDLYRTQRLTRIAELLSEARDLSIDVDLIQVPTIQCQTHYLDTALNAALRSVEKALTQ